MIGFILNGFVFVLIGLELPGQSSKAWGVRSAHGEVAGDRHSSCPASSSGRALLLVGVYAASLLPQLAAARRSPGGIRGLADRSPSSIGLGQLPRDRVTGRGAGACPLDFPEHDLITVGNRHGTSWSRWSGRGSRCHGASRRAGWDGTEADGDEATLGPDGSLRAGLDEIKRARPA